MGANPEPPPPQVSGQQTTPSTVPHTPGLTGQAGTSAPTNNLAVVSFVAGIASFFAHVIPIIGGFTVAIVAIVTGFIARGQIKRTGEQGMWMANAGIIIGFVHLVLGFLIVILVLFVVFVLGIALFGIAASGGHPSSPTPLPTG
jgi:Domain of unknown function (DUF4190)